MSTQFAHLMHTDKKGYFWKKRYDKSMIEIVQHTKTQGLATPRAAALTIRLMEIEALAATLQSMRETLKDYKDNLIKISNLVALLIIKRMSRAYSLFNGIRRGWK
ncbi:hypothetical protein [Enterobacter quasiroggenkampii]|uniref:hypothetical protein n=1 Tax=Enterobacter quasiroggenkampii TaxID=2497436 RepID=UPI0021D35FB3|nr:hypothetical protein [Enterobacter quasiroggenkampii]MCU6304758.1 hypothetical protein [Enterobacter quasiroggenkampii]